jgi:serine/threonine protein kinase
MALSIWEKALVEGQHSQILCVCFQVMAPNRKIFALKRIKLQGKDSEASKGFVDEITLLQRLRGKQNIIQLVDAEVTHRCTKF